MGNLRERTTRMSWITAAGTELCGGKCCSGTEVCGGKGCSGTEVCRGGGLLVVQIAATTFAFSSVFILPPRVTLSDVIICCSAELAHVEAVLDENPDFFQDYLIRKATRTMIDAWLYAHALPPGCSAAALPPLSGGDPTADLPLCR